jgi:hypothetical protein
VLFGQTPARENGVGEQVAAPNESSVDLNGMKTNLKIQKTVELKNDVTFNVFSKTRKLLIFSWSILKRIIDRSNLVILQIILRL